MLVLLRLLKLHLILPFLSTLVIGDKLDSILLASILPRASEACDSNYARSISEQRTNFTFTFSGNTSEWYSGYRDYESDLFLAEISHENSKNSNRSWTMRIGSAGNIYSFRGKYGEAIPPQYHIDAPWIDEVPQSVAVCLEKNTNSDYFIHQAGVYSKDSPYTNKPFYSPNIAKHCDGRTCSFGSWGQQAHVPTIHKSSALYFNSYTDCGDGVVEYNSIIHNAAPDYENGDDYTYLNVPWTGIRKSVLRDVLKSDPDDQELTQVWPVDTWPALSSIHDLQTIGGYTTFAEQLKVSEDVASKQPFIMPCIEDGAIVTCPDDGNEDMQLKLVISKSNNFHHSSGHSTQFNAYCVSVTIETQVHEYLGCRDCNLLFQNSRTDEGVNVNIVIHWAWNGKYLYFCTEDATDTDLNAIFQAGDEIIVHRSNVGKLYEDNLALTFVHGFQSPQVEHWAKNRIRYGRVGNVNRDATIFTLNSRLQVKPGDTYAYRQHLITGELSSMEAMGKVWSSESYEQHFLPGELQGEDIHLCSSNDTVFGTNIGGACIEGMSRCQGSSAPGVNLIPHFAIECGSRAYVGPKMYAFSPERVSDTEDIRSYVCAGEPITVRPKWKLLGYFEENSCSFLANAKYDADCCDPMPSLVPSSVPTQEPSQSAEPSDTPTDKPSFQPSSAPSLIPSQELSHHPSWFLSFMPTLEPSLSPTHEPSRQHSIEPSRIPTQKPSQYPSSHPSSSPTWKSSRHPSLIPSLIPTQEPLSLQPSSKLSITPSQEPSHHSSWSPSLVPTSDSSLLPTHGPSQQQSSVPSISSTQKPSYYPSPHSSSSPTQKSSRYPSLMPSLLETKKPSSILTSKPSQYPSFKDPESTIPTEQRTLQPSQKPNKAPTKHPTEVPTEAPNKSPTTLPTESPDESPTKAPTLITSSPSDNNNDPLPLSWNITMLKPANVLTNEAGETVIRVRYESSNRAYDVKVFEDDCETPLPAIPLNHRENNDSGYIDKGFVNVDVDLIVNENDLVRSGSNVWKPNQTGGGGGGSFSFCLSKALYLDGGTFADDEIVTKKDVLFLVSVDNEVAFEIGSVEIEEVEADEQDLSIEYRGTVEAYQCDANTYERIEEGNNNVLGPFDVLNVCVEVVVVDDDDDDVVVDVMTDLVITQEATGISFVALENGRTSEQFEDLVDRKCNGKVCMGRVQLINSFFLDARSLNVKGKVRLGGGAFRNSNVVLPVRSSSSLRGTREERNTEEDNEFDLKVNLAQPCEQNNNGIRDILGRFFGQ